MSSPAPISTCCVGSSCIPSGARWVFIGDSVARYQYLDLVYTLEGKDELTRQKERNPLKETTWPSWQEFYQGTHADLQPNERWCDCYRLEQQHHTSNDSKVPGFFRGDSTCEIRMHHRADCNISLWYLEAFGTRFPLLGHAKPDADSQKRLEPMTDAGWKGQLSSLWRLDWSGALERIVRPMLPTAVVMSTGFHATRGFHHSKVLETAKKVSPCVLWKTHTATRDGSGSFMGAKYGPATEGPARAAFKGMLFEAGLVTHRMNLTSSDFWDSGGIHFTPQSGVYRALNVAMLDRLADACPSGDPQPSQRRLGELSEHAQHEYAALRTRRTEGGAANASGCRDYAPSPIEIEWKNAWRRWEAERTSVTKRVFCELDDRLGAPRRPQDASTLQCGAKRVGLEPLAGLLRNPAFPCQNGTLKDALVPSYLWLDGIPPLAPKARAYLFDMGASTWTGGGPGEVEVGASATQWLIERYAEYGVAFDRIFAWEATPHSGAQVWSNMPVVMRARTSYYNVPISSDPNSSSHPWRHVLETARPIDFVVVKLDVDQPSIEASLVQQLIDDPAIHSRVDVLLWEQHWYRATSASKMGCSLSSEMCIALGFHRRKHVGGYEESVLSRTFETFTTLRQLGVLAHYWY